MSLPRKANWDRLICCSVNTGNVLAGIYVHVPFCTSFCTYCDFYSITQLGKKPVYLAALENEASRQSQFFNGVPPTTLYLGGGTPSLLSPDELQRLFSCVDTVFLRPHGVSFDSLREVTMEVNPDDVSYERALFWRSLGVSRISMGVQSFHPEVLRWMGRRHTAEQAVQAYRDLRRAGFQNISLDLIFGYESAVGADVLSAWDEDLSQMIALSPEHISAYQLSIEPGSKLAQWVRMGKVRELDEEWSAREYALLQKRLSEAGYDQYEISNFAKPGFYAVHNRSYWLRERYLGLGPAAHSFDGNCRWWNPDDVDAYAQGRGVVREILTDREAFNEQVMLGLRCVEGFRSSVLDPILYNEISPVIERLIRQGDLIASSDGCIKIPSEKLFVSDGIVCQLMLD